MHTASMHIGTNRYEERNLKKKKKNTYNNMKWKQIFLDFIQRKYPIIWWFHLGNLGWYLLGKALRGDANLFLLYYFKYFLNVQISLPFRNNFQNATCWKLSLCLSQQKSPNFFAPACIPIVSLVERRRHFVVSLSPDVFHRNLHSFQS